jgi:alginate O-acetyltransferase complex protein AlgI
MQFNSYSYLLALLIVVPVFWHLPVRFRRNYVLALSFAFYATWNVLFLGLPLLISAIIYWSSNGIRKGEAAGRRALWAGVAGVLFILGFFKYGPFVTENLGIVLSWFGAGQVSVIPGWALPLGISFYSFEAISYLLDTRQGRVKTASFSDLLLFIMFWPHLMAGPIVRTRELIPQLKFDRPFEPRLLYSGLDRILIGLVQKNVIANPIGSWVDDGFLPKLAALNTTIDNWALAVAFGIQIYFDFAAYSNMAIGAAQLIGISLPENFRYPYHASNPAEFWSRWHMTLSRWIRDYIFFPLNAGFQDHKIRLYASLVSVMGLVGLWHGAGWGFILWGLLHGVYLAGFRVFENWRGEFALQPTIVKLLWRGLTLAAIVAAWVPFRAASLGQAATMLKSMFGSLTLGYSYSVNFYLTTLFWCVWIALEPLAARAVGHLGQPENFKGVNALALRPLTYAVLLLFFMIFDDRDRQFIYFQF